MINKQKEKLLVMHTNLVKNLKQENCPFFNCIIFIS